MPKGGLESHLCLGHIIEVMGWLSQRQILDCRLQALWGKVNIHQRLLDPVVAERFPDGTNVNPTDD